MPEVGRLGEGAGFGISYLLVVFCGGFVVKSGINSNFLMIERLKVGIIHGLLNVMPFVVTLWGPL